MRSRHVEADLNKTVKKTCLIQQVTVPASSKIKKVGTFNEIPKFLSFRVSVVILDYVYGLPFHAVIV